MAGTPELKVCCELVNWRRGVANTLLRRGVAATGLLLALFFAGNLFAADVASDFNSANKLYAQGKFSDAATAYEKILQTGVQSPALLFNAGNAEFKAGHLGKAIAAYRQASLLSPRDAELRANLAFVRNQVQGATVRESRWQNVFGSLTLNEGHAADRGRVLADVCCCSPRADPSRARAETAQR